MPPRPQRPRRSTESKRSGWRTLGRMPAAFLITSVALIFIGYFLGWGVIFAFLATITYAMVDVAQTAFLKTGPGHLTILRQHGIQEEAGDSTSSCSSSSLSHPS